MTQYSRTISLLSVLRGVAEDGEINTVDKQNQLVPHQRSWWFNTITLIKEG